MRVTAAERPESVVDIDGRVRGGYNRQEISGMVNEAVGRYKRKSELENFGDNR